MELNRFPALLLVAGLLLCGACGGRQEAGAGYSKTSTQATEVLEIRGLVADVQAGSILKLDSLTIRDEEGRLWSFKVEGQLGFTPSHLREHQVLAQPVIVRYRETPDGLVALDLTD